MKKIIRNIFIAIVLSPLIVVIFITRVFIGKKSALNYWGPKITQLAKKSFYTYLWIPNIKGPEEFSKVKQQFQSIHWIFKLFYDIKVEINDTSVKCHLSNCPFCEVFNVPGLREYRPYICQGDWEFAKENKDKWNFERKHQIGTGDAYCDHTYSKVLTL